MRDIERAVNDWGMQRGIYEHSTPQAQTLKAVSELGELADAVIKGDLDQIIDGIGDTMVCLAHVAFMNGVDLYECFYRAYQEIKDRRGTMSPGGAWVKDTA